MDNEALMRRISAATELKRPAPRPTPTEPMARVSATPPPKGPSYVNSLLSQQQEVQPQAESQLASAQQQQQVQAQYTQAPIQAQQQDATMTMEQGATEQEANAAQATQNQHVVQAAPQPAPAPQSALSPVEAQQAPSIQTPASPVTPVLTPMAKYERPPYDPNAPISIDNPGDLLMSFRPAPDTGEVVPVPTENRAPKDARPQAFIIACDGTTAIVQGDTNCVDTVTGLTWAVGRMLTIKVGPARVVGMICDIKMPEGVFEEDERSYLHFTLELQGEVQDQGPGEKPKFVKGISFYPGVGSVVHQIRAADLATMYAATGGVNGVIGTLSQDSSIPSFVDIPDLLSKHFAVLGSTGCGKSASVSLLLHCAQELVPDLRTIILDPHNEYSRAFPDANTLSLAELDIPFWMLQLEEYVEVLFRGKPLVHEEVDALREFIPEAKTRFRDGEDRVKLRSHKGEGAITADTAAPYRMSDLIALINDEMGLLESRYDKSVLKSLKARITAHMGDARYAFMFRHKTIEDIAQDVINNFFCMPGHGNLTTIIQMAGMPAEVVNSVASVLCRLSFELAIAAKGNMKILVICEEAHRYVPAGKDGFEPTRRAIARIAKEGRKYGSFMGIISQRPSELDPTILSQCSTVFALRLTNDYDQEIIRRAISSSSASTVSFISSLSNSECIAFGEGMSTPMRMRFRTLPKEWLPGTESDVFGNSKPLHDANAADAVFHRWRNGEN